MVSLAERIELYWLKQNLRLRQGVLIEQIMDFEAKYGVRLPDDMREYFSVVNGMDQSEHWMADDNFISFWALDEVKPLAEEMPECVCESADSYFVFADYSIFAYAYAIRLSAAGNESHPVIVTYDRPVVIANSFTDFMEQYLRGNKNILFPAPEA